MKVQKVQIGEKKQDISYATRQCSYGIVLGENNTVGIIEVEEGYFLIGGGIEKGETKEEALKREVIEEAGYTIKEINPFLEVIASYKDEERGYLEVTAYCFEIRLEEKIIEPIEKDHNLIWIDPKEYTNKMFRDYQGYILEYWMQYINQNR